jgi:S1-C subfamily serine protease
LEDRKPLELSMSEQTTTNSLLALSGQLEHLAEAAAHAVVGMRLHGRVVASGLVWKPGIVVTASDALEADDDISVIAAGGQAVSAQVAGRDPTTDVAVLRLSDNLPEPPQLPTSDAARVGQMVLALGRDEDGVVANLGMVSVARGAWQSMRGGNIDSLIRLDMRLSRRSEGGLVIDGEGHMLGMAVFGPRQTPLVIPMSTIERVGAQLLADGRIRRGYLGVGLHGIRLDEGLAASLSLPDRRAIVVVSVDPNGPARTAGVHVGDVIVGFDGEPVSGVRGLFAQLTPESVGKSAELKMLRAGQIATARIAIGASPPP